jgi:hypothetical protein
MPSLSHLSSQVTALCESLVSRSLQLHDTFVDVPVQDDDQESCIVCLFSLNSTREAWSSRPEGGEKLKPVTKLPCGHIFHTPCVVPWLAAVVPQSSFLTQRHWALRLSCPLCVALFVVPEALQKEYEELQRTIEQAKRSGGTGRGLDVVHVDGVNLGPTDM